MTEQDLKIQNLKAENNRLAEENKKLKEAMERIVEKIDDLETYFDNGDFATCDDTLVVLKDVLRIVKEEGGIE